MKEFRTSRQDDLINALMNHPSNNQKSERFALGYMSMMLAHVIDKLSPADRKEAYEQIQYLIDRHKGPKQTAKAS